jgi:molybdenum storage protein
MGDLDQVDSSAADPLPVGGVFSLARLREADDGTAVAILPRANVVKIGAQSLIDRGRSAVFPVIEELGANAAEHQLIIGVGGHQGATRV